jgi:hypothetical protein
MAVTRTPKTNNPGVIPVSTSTGEFLHFALIAGGPVPIFTFVSSVKSTLWEATDFPGHPKTLYEWEHLRNPSDIQQMEVLTLGLSIFSNADYTYKVQVKDKTGNPLRPVLEISYSGKPTDSYDESFRVIIQ